jgi:ATP-dependent DNA helicase RecG
MTQRPFILDSLFRSVGTIRGVGPRTIKLYEKLLGNTKILDVIFHKPISVIERQFAPSIMSAKIGDTACIKVTIEKHIPNERKSQPYRIRARDASGFLELAFFHAQGDWISKAYPIGQTLMLCGQIDDFKGGRQMTHPDILDTDNPEKIEIIYPLTAGLSNKVFRKTLLASFEQTPILPEWIDKTHLTRMQWPDWKSSLHHLHHPQSESDLSPAHPALTRLAYDEFLANQLTLAIIRLKQRKLKGRSFIVTGQYRQKLERSLPWPLTRFQQEALSEIDKDMALPHRMLRLLQGDVGSGKTIVAALAMMNAVDSGAQAAIMAPTEILARQHAETLKPFFDLIGIKFCVLTGRDKGKARAEILQDIISGNIQIIIGTHALFQDGVEFANLGLAVIDEQHRFGVHQRLQLSTKTLGTDVLVMTATPIPRTLALTAYGDMEVSRIVGKPQGRKPIDTRLIPQDNLETMIERLREQVKQGIQIYWVCPLVEESEILDLAAAEERYLVLQQIFGDKVGLVHGRLKPKEKDEVMAKFSQGEIAILVATTVIEVGVNVPNASIIVIEHAERFGLAQLHQLRGRVGRGSQQSYCFLVYANHLTETAKERLKILRETEDGFLIAEKDLELRGGGEVLGTKQSGMIEFRLANLSAHSDLLISARQDAALILEKDPDLKTERGQALRTLLYLFERDQAINFLKAG